MELLKPPLLTNEHTTQNVAWYADSFPTAQDDQGVRMPNEYVVIDGVRHEMSELMDADWLILQTLFPNGASPVW